MILQKRDINLLGELPVMRLVDTELVKKAAGFRSTRRANARLLKLQKAGFLNRFFQGTEAGGKKALYTLSPKGARLIGVPTNGIRHAKDELIPPNALIAHQMAVNEIYCAAKYGPIPIEGTQFARWIRFSKPLGPGVPLIPDGCFEITTGRGRLVSFLEVDLGGEREPVWRKKVQSYLHYVTSGQYQRQFGQSGFRILVITNSESRAETLRRFVLKLTDKIFWFSTLEAIRREGLWGSVWLRPSGDTLRSFL